MNELLMSAIMEKQDTGVITTIPTICFPNHIEQNPTICFPNQIEQNQLFAFLIIYEQQQKQIANIVMIS